MPTQKEQWQYPPEIIQRDKQHTRRLVQLADGWNIAALPADEQAKTLRAKMSQNLIDEHLDLVVEKFLPVYRKIRGAQ